MLKVVDFIMAMAGHRAFARRLTRLERSPTSFMDPDSTITMHNRPNIHLYIAFPCKRAFQVLATQSDATYCP